VGSGYKNGLIGQSGAEETWVEWGEEQDIILGNGVPLHSLEAH
jgi:hypothetical protein